HPILDPADPNYEIAAPGALQFYNSTDIRIDVPDRSDPRNKVRQVDHVSFESTPIEVQEGVAGSIIDRVPYANDVAQVYVQVTNFGKKPAHDVRVFAMWRDPTVGPLSLPTDFWTATFPGSGCGSFNASTGWNALSSTCVVLQEVRPEMPEV